MAIRDLVPRIGRGGNQVPVRRTETDPFRNLQREMNRLFDDFFSDFPLALRPGDRGLAAAGFSPRIDVSETDKEVRVSAELPGMDEKPFSISSAEPLCFTIAKVGPFSEALHGLREGDRLWYRGPFGTSFPASPAPACRASSSRPPHPRGSSASWA